MKAVLVAEATPFRRTHDIIVLKALLPASLVDEIDSVDVVVLQPWAVDGRYPGDLPDATHDEATEVVATASAIIVAVTNWLQKPTV
jgi:HEPN domain-containing protein